MAFQPLPVSTNARGKAPSSIPSIAIHHAHQASISIPRTLLREAGMSDLPGAKFDVLIGTGSDEGTIAVIQGSRVAAGAVGNPKNPNRLMLRVSGLAQKDKKLSSTPLTFEVGRRQIIFTLPASFPVSAEAATAAAAAEPAPVAPRPLELGAAA